MIFEAQAGTTYKIAVDGDGFFPPGGGPPGIEGAFELRIEETPIPTNDDFADAVALSSELHEGSFYFASASGSSWNATKETGEPSHAGDPGGASVWYSWFAPSSGAARVSTCFGRPGLLDVYTGSSVSSLTPVVSATRSFSCSVEFPAEAGTVYRIAVDGKLDTKTGIAESNDFQLMIFLRPTILMEQASGPPAISVPDVSPPETRIQKRFLKRMPPTVVMDFTSNEPESTFRCKLDKRRYTACRSPRKLKNLKPGRHIFKVVAVDAAGNADPTPATATFSIPKPRSR